MIYPSNQKPPIWSLDPGIIAYNCQKHGVPHPVLAMPMWEGAGDLTRDYSGYGNHGTITGADWVKEGLYFSTNDYVGLGTTFLCLSKIGTICTTVKFNSVTSDHGIITKWNTAAFGGEYLLQFDTVSFKSSATDVILWAEAHDDSQPHGSWPVVETGSINVGQEYDVALRRDISSNSLKIYLDGEDATNNTYNLANMASHDETALNVQLGDSVAGIKDGDHDQKYFYVFDVPLSDYQVKFISDNPYFMFQIPEELYGYAAAAAEYLLEESFEGAGYENSWSENLDSGCTLDEDSAIPGTPPTGSGSQCLKAITIDNVDRDARATHVFGYTDIVYTYAYIYIDEAIISEGEIFFSLATTTLAGSICASLLFGKDSSGNIICNLYYHSDGSAKHTSDFIIPLDSWSRFEYKYDKTNLAWEFRINGVNKGSGSLIDPLTPYRIELGVKSSTGYGSVTLYTDLFVLADDWVGEAPTIYPAWYYNMLKRRNA